MQVLLAADSLVPATNHGIANRQRSAVLAGDRIKGITDEQTRAFAQATEASGLALIDGQAGRGKELHHLPRGLRGVAARFAQKLHAKLDPAQRDTSSCAKKTTPYIIC